MRTKCWKAAAAAFVGDSKPATEFFFFKVTFIFSIDFFIKLTGRTRREGERVVWLEVFQARGNDMGEDAGGRQAQCVWVEPSGKPWGDGELSSGAGEGFVICSSHKY